MLPRFIYELLPYIYGPTGILAATQLDSDLGRFSGGLMFSAALVIWSMRRYYRSWGQ